MFYRARYLHVQTEYGKDFNGFSVLLEPSEFPESVKMRVTFCSKVDHFSRKSARLALANKSAFHILVQYLPAKLEEYYNQCMGIRTFRNMGNYHKGNSFAWIWKYFL